MYIGCKSNKQVNMQTHIEQRGSLNIDIFNISTNSTYLLFAICNYLFSQRCCCIQLRYCSTCKELFPFLILVNIPYHLNVHTRHVSLSATETPWHYSRENPATINLEQTFLFVVLVSRSSPHRPGGRPRLPCRRLCPPLHPRTGIRDEDWSRHQASFASTSARSQNPGAQGHLHPVYDINIRVMVFYFVPWGCFDRSHLGQTRPFPIHWQSIFGQQTSWKWFNWENWERYRASQIKRPDEIFQFKAHLT